MIMMMMLRMCAREEVAITFDLQLHRKSVAAVRGIVVVTIIIMFITIKHNIIMTEYNIVVYTYS